MVPLLVRCLVCRRVFPSGFDFAPGSTFRLEGNLTQCPYCGSFNAVPDGDFSVTLDGIVRLIADAANPLETARELQKAVKDVQSTGDPSPLLAIYPGLTAWLPNTPEKAAAYITIIAFILDLILKLLGTGATIDVTQVINVYNQAPTVSIPTKPAITAQQPRGSAPSRNAPCPCGSGRKYKKCHGK
jgi:SEC-C motif-containing protein